MCGLCCTEQMELTPIEITNVNNAKRLKKETKL